MLRAGPGDIETSGNPQSEPLRPRGVNTEVRAVVDFDDVLEPADLEDSRLTSLPLPTEDDLVGGFGEHPEVLGNPSGTEDLHHEGQSPLESQLARGENRDLSLLELASVDRITAVLCIPEGEAGVELTEAAGGGRRQRNVEPVAREVTGAVQAVASGHRPGERRPLGGALGHVGSGRQEKVAGKYAARLAALQGHSWITVLGVDGVRGTVPSRSDWKGDRPRIFSGP